MQQKLTFDASGEARVERGARHKLLVDAPAARSASPDSSTGRQAVLLRQLLDTRNDPAPGRSGHDHRAGQSEAPQGDFSDLLRLPNPSAVPDLRPADDAPDPLNPGRMIRNPFPNNIIPRRPLINADGTYRNPLWGCTSRLVPAPNQNFVENGQQPSGNFYQGGQPDSPVSQRSGVPRVDFNVSPKDRVFFRTSGVKFLEYVSDWTYQNADPTLRMHSADRSRYQWSSHRDLDADPGSTVLDTSIATNRFNQVDKFLGLKQFTPSDAGLPTYLDEFCSAMAAATLPSIIASPAIRASAGAWADGDTATHMQGTVLDHVGQGTAYVAREGGLRRAQRDRTGGGNRSGQMTFDRTYTRQYSERVALTPSNLGLSLAAFELGLPTSASINDELPSSVQQLLDGGIRPGHLAPRQAHRQCRSPVRVQDRRE